MLLLIAKRSTMSRWSGYSPFCAQYALDGGISRALARTASLVGNATSTCSCKLEQLVEYIRLAPSFAPAPFHPLRRLKRQQPDNCQRNNAANYKEERAFHRALSITSPPASATGAVA